MNEVATPTTAMDQVERMYAFHSIEQKEIGAPPLTMDVEFVMPTSSVCRQIVTMELNVLQIIVLTKTRKVFSR
ncbi:MAG: hypothetical protein DHS20C16_12820 [Phycisphaerae bacterium]|nr:MAG: hypothetical protein DHS20C16_12820 [Phycisphaerae bacterium]